MCGDNGKWEFPGDSTQLHETCEQAVIRNTQAKHGIVIGIADLGYDAIDKVAEHHWLSATFYPRYLSGTPNINQPDKCDEIGWFRLAEREKLPLSRISKLNLIDLRSAN